MTSPRAGSAVVARHDRTTTAVGRRRPLAIRRLAAGLVIGVALLTLAACGGSTASPGPAGTSPGGSASGTASAADAAYVQAAGAVLDSLALAAEHVTAATRAPDVASASWRAALVAALDEFAAIQSRASALQAPAPYAAAQQQLQQAADHFQQVAGLLRGAIDPPDPAKLDEAAALLPVAIAEAASARAELSTAAR